MLIQEKIKLNNLVKTYTCQTMPQATSNNQVILNDMCHSMELAPFVIIVTTNITCVLPCQQ
jgi:hypothetical protein